MAAKNKVSGDSAGSIDDKAECKDLPEWLQLAVAGGYAFYKTLKIPFAFPTEFREYYDYNMSYTGSCLSGNDLGELPENVDTAFKVGQIAGFVADLGLIVGAAYAAQNGNLKVLLIPAGTNAASLIYEGVRYAKDQLMWHRLRKDFDKD